MGTHRNEKRKCVFDNPATRIGTLPDCWRPPTSGANINRWLLSNKPHPSHSASIMRGFHLAAIETPGTNDGDRWLGARIERTVLAVISGIRFHKFRIPLRVYRNRTVKDHCEWRRHAQSLICGANARAVLPPELAEEPSC